MITISMFSLSGEGMMLKALHGTLLLPLIMILTVTSWPSSAAPDGAINGKFSGEYSFYSRELGDTGLPTKADTKMNIYVSGAFAAQLFRRLGSGASVQGCGSDERELRSKGNIDCSRDRKTGDVDCGFGYDLRTGKASGGMDC